jgi:hypothetical protein
VKQRVGTPLENAHIQFAFLRLADWKVGDTADSKVRDSCPQQSRNFQRAPVQFSTRNRFVRCCGLESPRCAARRPFPLCAFICTIRD